MVEHGLTPGSSEDHIRDLRCSQCIDCSLVLRWTNPKLIKHPDLQDGYVCYTDIASKSTYIRRRISQLLVTQVDEDVALLRSSASIDEPAPCGNQCPCTRRGVGCAYSWTAGCRLVSPRWAGIWIRVSFPVQRCEGAVQVVAGLWLIKNRNQDRFQLRWFHVFTNTLLSSYVTFTLFLTGFSTIWSSLSEDSSELLLLSLWTQVCTALATHFANMWEQSREKEVL